MGIVKALEMDGLDCRVLFKQLGLDYAALNDPDARFPQDSMTRLWQRAVELSGNPAIGLNMGKVVRPASFHVAGYALMSSNTLAEGFQRLVRYQRIIAESADEAYRQMGEALPDLILLDVVMPGQNGFQLTRHLSRHPQYGKVPVFLCTSKSQETDRVWGMRQGARDYITKPINAKDLLAKIAAI